MTPSSHAPRLPNHIIGTAGHVDHGKSTLVKALTGIDPDRLAEEKARQMTIDLGFAWFSLPNGQTIGVVDVPGHRDFIENMLAGVGGIDAVLFVIAADEGVMPQTREHLAIIDLLGIENGLIVLTKIDTLNDDQELLLMLEDDIHETVKSTSLAHAPIIPVSALTNIGMSDLRTHIANMISALPPPPIGNTPRLPVDRVFTMSGFGTVVTGTLTGGILCQGDEIEFQPGGQRARIRGVQWYRESVQCAFPGGRAAVNIIGLEKSEIQRGSMLSLPGLITPTTLIDVHFRHLPGASRPLKHNAEVKLFTNTTETIAHIRLLASEELPPGEQAYLQLRLESPIAVVTGDRFIIRYPSPPETIGGGTIIDPHPPERYKRFREGIIDRLTLLSQGTPAQRIAQIADSPEPLKRTVLKTLTGFDDSTFERALTEAIAQRALITFSDQTVLAAHRWEILSRLLIDELTAFHAANPLKIGIPREELRSRLNVKGTTLNMLLETLENVTQAGKIVRLTDHVIHFNSVQQTTVDRLLADMNAAPYTPPSTAEAVALVSDEVLYALIELGEIVQVQPDVIFTRSAYRAMIQGVITLLSQHESVTTARVRDHFGTSRKYAIALLEHLDTIGITRRSGDVRVRGSHAAN